MQRNKEQGGVKSLLASPAAQKFFCIRHFDFDGDFLFYCKPVFFYGR